MIQTENIDRKFYVDNIKPDYLIELPLGDETIEYKNATCFFLIQKGHPDNLKYISVDFFDSFTNDDFKNDKYKGFPISFILVFENKPFSIDDIKSRIKI